MSEVEKYIQLYCSYCGKKTVWDLDTHICPKCEKYYFRGLTSNWKIIEMSKEEEKISDYIHDPKPEY